MIGPLKAIAEGGVRVARSGRLLYLSQRPVLKGVLALPVARTNDMAAGPPPAVAQHHVGDVLKRVGGCPGA